MLGAIKQLFYSKKNKLNYINVTCPFCLFENNVLINKYGGNSAAGTCKCGAQFNIN
jgi:hypothetical protein